MVNNEIVAELVKNGPQLAVKWLSVAGLFMYTVFAIIVIRQTAIMAETFDSEVNAVVRLFAWLHLGMALFLLVAAIIWL